MTRATTVLSFDVEEHYRIEAAAHLSCPDDLKHTYSQRTDATTRDLLRLLAAADCKATFFILGEVAVKYPKLVRDIHEAGHEIASHGWNHEPVHRLTPATFRDDLTKSKHALEQAAGAPVSGYRAPTFSVMRQTAWAIDVLQECGYRYDSSVFPVVHDRYGVPDAPVVPFRCVGPHGGKGILEFPPLTIRGPFTNLPVGGGGYFRLLPLGLLKTGIWMNRQRSPSVAMLYFHPWEFDPGQPRLPLSRLSGWRTYVGVGRSSGRLRQLLRLPWIEFRRAVDLLGELESMLPPTYHLMGSETNPPRHSRPTPG
jgi:polysaccharide deacetylase family protein (PEP-CTERM system associated)